MLLRPGHVFAILGAILGAILPLVYYHRHILPLPSVKTASPVPHSQVYLLGSSRTGIAAISTALRTLGYRQILPPDVSINSRDSDSVAQDTFSVIASEFGVQGLSSISPSAKFIMPVEYDKAPQIDHSRIQPSERSWLDQSNEEGYGDDQGYAKSYQIYTSSIHDFFAQPDQEAKLLEFHVNKDSPSMGEDWSTLCKFLGLGYSVVERHRLRQFPKGREAVWTQNLLRVLNAPRIRSRSP
jgi:hypothetical protein